MRQVKAFCKKFYVNNCDACDVTARPCETFDETNFDRISTNKENDWNCLGRILGNQCGWRTGKSDNYGHSTANQIFGQCR